MRGSMESRWMIAALAVVFSAIPVSAKKKGAMYLKTRPTAAELECARQELDASPRARSWFRPETMIIDCVDDIQILAAISAVQGGPGGSRTLIALLMVHNARAEPVEVGPQKVFLLDNHSEVHLAMPDYVAKSIVREQHQLPPFAPPPPEKYYTVTQVPVDSQPAGPIQVYAIQDIGTGYLLYGTQPTMTTYYPEISEHYDSSKMVGYELGYLLAAWLNKRDAKKQIKFIDENFFHHKQLEPHKTEKGILNFDDFPTAPPVAKPSGTDEWSVELEEPIKDLAATQTNELRDEMLRRARELDVDAMDGSVRMLIFVGDRQFFLRFGPELVEEQPK